MIAGSVLPPRLDLANKDLVEAHLRSVWMSLVGLDLKNSIAELLDLGAGGYPDRSCAGPSTKTHTPGIPSRRLCCEVTCLR
jgi:hypothetical protein